MEKIKNLSEKFINFSLKILGKILPKSLVGKLEKILTVEVFLYIVFGILTTIVNIGSFAILTTICNIEENIANTIAIILAVLFAYFTNRGLVFNSTASTFNEKLFEFFKFILGRAFTMVIELVGCFALFRIFPGHDIISKSVVTIIVIILNFFISKFFAFKKKDESIQDKEKTDIN